MSSIPHTAIAAISQVGWLFQISAADSPAMFFMLVLALSFWEPVQNRLQTVASRMLSRDRADHRLLLQDYGRDLTSAPLDTERILTLLLDRCQAGLSLEQAAVFLRDPALNRYPIHKQIGTPLPPDIRIEFNANDELPRRLAIGVDHPRNDETRRLSSESNAPRAFPQKKWSDSAFFAQSSSGL
jgi:hypothetical protein